MKLLVNIAVTLFVRVWIEIFADGAALGSIDPVTLFVRVWIEILMVAE